MDGIFGAKTYNAVVKFQKDRGLAVDGIVGKNTWAALGVTGTTVVETQTGIKTYNAVVKFQTARALAVDGIVGVNTWGALA